MDVPPIRTRPAGIKGSHSCPPDPLNQLVGTLLAMRDRQQGTGREREFSTVGAKDLRTWQVFPKNGEEHLQV